MDARWTGCDVFRRVRRRNIQYPMLNIRRAYGQDRRYEGRRGCPNYRAGGIKLVGWMSWTRKDRQGQAACGFDSYVEKGKKEKKKAKKKTAGPNLFCSTAINDASASI